MAFPTAVNNQITDAVSQTDVQVVGNAPAVALATLYQTAIHAIGLSMQNAVAAQQNGAMLANAVTTQCINQILGTARAS